MTTIVISIRDVAVQLCSDALDAIQQRHDTAIQLSIGDLKASPEYTPTPFLMEQIARIADAHEFDGNVFRSLCIVNTRDPLCLPLAIRLMRKQIKVLHQLIETMQATVYN